MRRCELFLRMPLLILLFLGLAEACIPREVAIEEKIKLLKGILGMMTRLSTDDRSEEEMKRQRTPSARFMKKLPEEEKPPEKLSPATTPKKPPSKRTRWNMLKCTYMMVTFLFVSYNKGDWCYCHHCNTEMDIRTDPCCSF
ncbi:epididymal protein 13 isoform X12 [Canis lupus familiaris]|uniref:epididymal protein 13 isoform X12 n=1 Tax=Canis lupus familiaris TaxID=9615 RepID=UPI0015F16C11|nr:epididymal protein 13 isoform X12 [Canis lupus familiaris]